MVRKGYFLITVFYLPGFCREPCIYLSLPSLGSGFWNSVSPAWHAAWQLSLHPSRGPLLSCPCSAQRQPTSFSTSGQAQCCSGPSAALAEFPWLLSDSRLFPAGLSELQVKPPLQGSALFADAVGSAVESSDALSPPGPGGHNTGPIAHSVGGLYSAAGQKVPPQQSLPGDISTPSLFPPVHVTYHGNAKWSTIHLNLPLCSETFLWPQAESGWLGFQAPPYIITPAFHQLLKFIVYQPS